MYNLLFFDSKTDSVCYIFHNLKMGENCCPECDQMEVEPTPLSYFKDVTPDTLTTDYLEELYKLMCKYGKKDPDEAHYHEIKAMMAYFSKASTLSHEDSIKFVEILKKMNDLKLCRGCS